MKAVLFACVQLALSQGTEEERSELRAHLAEQKQLQAALAEDRAALSELLPFLEWRAKILAAQKASLLRQEQALLRQVTAAQRLEAWARMRTELQMDVLGPRLLSVYRLKRRKTLDMLWSAKDLQVFLRARRALGSVLEEDVRALAELRRAEKVQRAALDRLDRLKVQRAMMREALDARAELEAEQASEVKDLLAFVLAQSRQSARKAQELEHAERQLTRLLTAQRAMPATGFGALRGKLSLPTEGRVEMGFGKVVQARSGTALWHKGLDIRAPLGAPVKAVASGVVAYIGKLRGYGPVLIVEHSGGFHTVMAHLGSVEVKARQKVEAGQLLGRVGEEESDKGPYLHFQIRELGLAVDPAPWLSSNALSGGG